MLHRDVEGGNTGWPSEPILVCANELEVKSIPGFIDMTGARFGKWTVLELAEPLHDKRGYNVIRWKCRCDCGTERDVIGTTLRSGKSQSCGCDVGRRATCAKENFTTHGESKTRLYRIWAYMKKRCSNPNASNYKDYGARGISVCDEWMEFEPFREWALAHGYDDDLSIDRIDVNGNYCPDNCRWVDGVAQANNKRNSVRIAGLGETHTIAEWARLLNVDYKYLHKKISSGKNIDDIISTLH